MELNLLDDGIGDLAPAMSAATGFEQKPRPPFSLVYTDFDQTSRRDITMLIAHVVSFAQAARERSIVIS